MTLCAKECGMFFFLLQTEISEKYEIRSVLVHKQSNRKTTKPLVLTFYHSLLPPTQSRVTLPNDKKNCLNYIHAENHIVCAESSKSVKRSGTRSLQTDIIWGEAVDSLSKFNNNDHWIPFYYWFVWTANAVFSLSWSTHTNTYIDRCVCWIQCEPTELHF